jgi:hypothetical protein
MAGFPEISFIVSPHSSDLYHVLKDFQSGLAGVLGFTGAIITLVVNARLARKARLTTIQDERSALRAALLAELRMANGRLVRNAEIFDKKRVNKLGAAIPLERTEPIFESAVEKLGLLTPREITAVLAAYGDMLTGRAQLRFRNEVHNDSIAIESGHLAGAIEVTKKMLNSVDIAIRELERH